nr:immunoglobulin heavy chain junction region [Macaca mulatta]MOY23813.1 immunoglobulin heavy chain junction region [Macaca mulatta]
CARARISATGTAVRFFDYW